MIALAASACLLQTGCATRPVPGDYNQSVNTYGIVQKIRCETRDAVSGYLRGALANIKPELAKNLRGGGARFDHFYNKVLPTLSPGVRNPITRYWNSVIGFDFTFTIEESNIASVGANFSDPISKGLFKIGFSAGRDRVRKNMRNLQVIGLLGELLTSEPLDRVCSKISVPKQPSYPITGNIGMREFLGTFFNLNQSAGLTALKDGGAPAISDTITFTTTINAGTTPNLTINRIGSGFRLVDGNLDLSVTRMDKHMLVMSVLLPEFDKINGVKTTTSNARAAKELAKQRKIRLQEKFADSIIVIN